MKGRPGLLLLLALLLLPAGVRYGRGVLFCEERSPAFSIAKADRIWVELGEGFPNPGVHQFIDGTTSGGVIEMALSGKNVSAIPSAVLNRPLRSGEFISLRVEDTEIVSINSGWMKASRRMVLRIPLQPQTMNSNDWLALPGIGPKLAERIEADRQKNGEFSTFSELLRVPGIGPGRLEAWSKYYLTDFESAK